MKFEEKKFCRIRTLAERWDSSPDRILYLVSRGILLAWHPEGKSDCRGVLIEVRSIIEAEKNGFIQVGK